MKLVCSTAERCNWLHARNTATAAAALMAVTHWWSNVKEMNPGALGRAGQEHEYSISTLHQGI
jgi:hypothetical protein